MPVIATPPVCRVAVNSTVTRSPSGSADTAVTVPEQVSTSPGQTCSRKRTPKRRTGRAPSQSVAKPASNAAENMPCANTDGYPADRASSSS